jgi:rfaE bifunctional protein kinase chain/domain
MTTLTRPAAATLLARAAGRRLVVVGDVCLDEYLVGRPERLSREGPVPVLAFERRFAVPGGAANPARNLAALGAVALQVGVVGQDATADELRAVLGAAGIDVAGLVVDPGRPTVLKTRVVAESLSVPQQVARIDRQARAPIAGAVEAAVVEAIRRGAATADGILVSHYRSGAVTPAVCDAARSAARERGIWLTVDAQGELDRFHGFDLVRVGRQDAAESLRRPLETEADFEAAARGLREEIGARVVILGRGAEGMSVADDVGGYAVIHPANVSEVFDVSGAGDTVIAVVTLALAAGAGVRDAVELANYAAGFVVRRLGVAAPTVDELLAEIDGRG